MKTAILTPCFLDGLDPSRSSRLDRNIRFADWLSDLKLNRGFFYTHVFLIDNDSSFENKSRFNARTAWEITRSWPRLAGGGGYNYPYCWRALYYTLALIAEGFEKIIFLDSDGFILTPRLVNYVNECHSGWEAFYCPKYQFPESSFHILNKDAFPVFLEMAKTPWQEMNGKCMETTLPFTKINRDFNCDRWGEERIAQRPDMDFYSQAPVDLPLTFQAGAP